MAVVATMRDAIVAAINLNLFNQNSDRIKMANIAQAVNVGTLMKQNRKPCIRCLLWDMDKRENYQTLQRYLDSFDEKIRATEEV